MPIALWSWVVNTCGDSPCIEVSHLKVHAPIRLAYPRGVCVYCGRHAGTKDHLLPRPWTGDAQRHFIVTVPACGTCNSILRDTITVSITERRALAHARIRKRFAKVLRTKDATPEELSEYGTLLRQHIETAMADKAEVVEMLEWPKDPAFDVRALERSGIEDPFILGLIIADDDPEMLSRVREIA